MMEWEDHLLDLDLVVIDLGSELFLLLLVEMGGFHLPISEVVENEREEFRVAIDEVTPIFSRLVQCEWMVIARRPDDN